MAALHKKVFATATKILLTFDVLQVTSGSLAVYLSRGQEVWLETKDYRGMRGKPEGYSIFSGFLLHAH